MFKKKTIIVGGLLFIHFLMMVLFKLRQNYTSLAHVRNYYSNLKKERDALTGVSADKNPENCSLEMQMILETTPYLWRHENETVRSRLASQKQFIQRISRTDFVQSARIKKILLQDFEGGFYFYFTNYKVNCPYAPEFEKKCELIKETPEDKEKGISKYDGMDASVAIRRGHDERYETREPVVPYGVHQIFYILEPPHHTDRVILGTNHAILSSYSRISDIPIPYREVSYRPKSDLGKFCFTVAGQHFLNKTKLVTALISNCNRWDVKNNRMGYIKELKKHIDVDVYGRCLLADLDCPEDCLSTLEKSYKFYLAFENGNCVDYITEKFFVNGLSHDMLPVVMGAQKENYESAAPPNSFIHVDDFESPKALAEYLHHLDKNEELYRQYFKWKETRKITHTALEDFFCRSCGMLFYADFIAPPKWETDETLFSDVNKCLPPNQWNWT